MLEQASIMKSGVGEVLMPTVFRSTLRIWNAHYLTETIIYADESRDVRTVNVGVGTLLAFLTFHWTGSPWNDYEEKFMNWAVVRVEAVDFAAGTFTFLVVGHLAEFGANGRDHLFSRVGELYEAQSWPEVVLGFTLAGEMYYRKLYKQSDMFTLPSPKPTEEVFTKYKARREALESRAGTPVNSGNNSLADLFLVSPSEEGQSYSSKDDMKVVQDYQGGKHLIRSSYAVKFLSFMNLFYRTMEEGKREAIIRTDTEYDRAGWDEAVDSFRFGQVVPGMDPSIATLCECYKLDNMPVLLDEVKLDRARLCQWKTRDLTWLSIVDFHEAPHGLQDQLKGTDRATRLYLAGCVRGFLTFLKVMFYSHADSLLTRLITWLERQGSLYEKQANTEFVRCRIDSMLVDFWSEVRSNAKESRRFPTACDFQVPGAVWGLLSRYEEALFEQMALDEYPHIRFYEKPKGDFWRTLGGGKGTAGQTTPAKTNGFGVGDRTQVSYSTPTRSSPTGGKPISICPFHLACKLQVKRTDGTTMGPCSYETNCRHPHVDLNAITATQATDSLHNCKPSMTSKVAAAISTRASDFKA
jgi:hypothetical protein